MAKKLNVLVVDDSLIFRSAIIEAIKNDENIAVIGSVGDGKKALEFINTSPVIPDMVTLDVEMPVMDGLETLNAIRQINQSRGLNIGVIMVSAHTDKGAQATIQALEAGAFDFILKPNSESLAQSMEMLRSSLLVKLRYFAIMKNQAAHRTPPKPLAEKPKPAPPPHIGDGVGPIRSILIGVSTGGPQTLTELLPVLCEVVDLPIFIVQHMPPMFTETLAKSLNAKCSFEVREAAHGDEVADRKIFIAPGGRHMTLKKQDNGSIVVELNDQAPENGCKPSVDVLFRSASDVYSGNVVAVILTGMGRDGTNSTPGLKKAGAHLIVQDEPTSVVWGMPKSALDTGCVDEVLPVKAIPGAVRKEIGKRART